MRRKYTTFIVISALIFCLPIWANIDSPKYHDYRAKEQNHEMQKMQDFHLEQAKLKLQNKQSNNAWGDFAYLLCHVPNHHQALQHMLTLAPQLQKQNEMRQYLSKAAELFPDDAVVRMLYGAFLFNVGEDTAARDQFRIAQALGGFKFNDSALKNN